MKPLSTGLNFFAWLFIRLPLAFSLPFTAMSLFWILGGFRLANDHVAKPVAALVGSFLEAHGSGTLATVLITNLEDFVHAAGIIGLFAVGFVVAYNVSALVNWVLVVSNLKPVPYSAGPPELPQAWSGLEAPFRNTRRIGIVLAGGGAKGSYQAGAMKAIYRFLEQHDALSKVRVIASTSIGSWNALFWLSNLIKPGPDWHGTSVHERWWRSISGKSLTAPSWYVPFFRNAFLSSLPWRQCYDGLFGRPDVRQQLLDTPVHFYFTRSDVCSGELSCVTNNPAPPQLQHVTYECLDRRGDATTFLQGVKSAVFASMDLPPLFPYTRNGNRLFEDGGVIDNLPITFPAVDGCDLIFILPLNSDFVEQPNQKSVLARLLRVMDVRQGVLERSGFKMLYLYNELAALRDAGGAELQSPLVDNRSAPLTYAMQRRNQLIKVFAVCPLKSFVRETIDTRELWKRKQAGTAFQVMEQATSQLLPGFDFEIQSAVRVALVSGSGDIAWDERF